MRIESRVDSISEALRRMGCGENRSQKRALSLLLEVGDTRMRRQPPQKRHKALKCGHGPSAVKPSNVAMNLQPPQTRRKALKCDHGPSAVKPSNVAMDLQPPQKRHKALKCGHEPSVPFPMDRLTAHRSKEVLPKALLMGFLQVSISKY
uniref:Uncharacterized protein n=1 Tax=Setaria digitata TaxID=48799 RepID=A0A915PCK7_9BILA